MHNSQNIFLSVLVICLLIVGGVLLLKRPQPADFEYPTPASSSTETVTYIDQEYGITFSYPTKWGTPSVRPGNSQCPEEDTYRTADQLVIFDREIRFPEFDLKNTDSEIRTGIRFYRMDTSKAQPCYGELLRKIATKEMTGQEISSVRLEVINIPGFYGIHNQNASRLDTEGTELYTLFVKESDDIVLIIQPFMNFVPWADTPEWAEIDSKYQNNVLGYFQTGVTAAPIREFIFDFRKTVEGMRYTK